MPDRARSHPSDADPRAHALDRLIGAQMPALRSLADVAALEAQAPWAERVAARSTYEALQRGAAVNPDAPALIFLPDADPDAPHEQWSHRAFLQRVTQVGNLFHRLGVGPDAVVSLLLPLLPQAYFALFGAQVAGIANPVNHLLSAAQIAEILHAAGTQVLVTVGPTVDAAIWAKVQAVQAQLPGLKAVLVARGAEHPETAALDLDRQADACASDHLESGRQIAAHDWAGYFHTGGTTGTPKLVRHTHANQVYQAWGLRLMQYVLPGRATLCGLPLFHVGGALTQGLAVLANGGHIVTLSALGWRNPNALHKVWQLVARFRPPLFGGVPTVVAAALQIPMAEADTSSLEFVSAGGSAIPVAVIEAYEKLGLPVLEVYGMTETSSVHVMGYRHMPRVAGAVGRCLPYARVRVVRLDADGRLAGACAVNEMGVVAMSGPGVFAGYLSESHNRTAFVEPGWVNSGDLGRIDADGQLWITGRAKDLIIRGGHNIDPAPIEELLYQHPAVAVAALVGQPDAYAGELPVAYVELKAGHQATPAELIHYLRERTPERAAVPVDLHLVQPMPLTAVGKIFKPALRVDAIGRVATQLLQGKAPAGCTFAAAVLPHPAHGHVIEVRISGADPALKQACEVAVHDALDPLTTRHVVAWQ